MNDWFELLELSLAWFQQQPFLLLGLLLLLLAAMAMFRGTYPSRVLVVLMIFPSAVAFLLLFKHDLFPLIMATDVALFAVACWDMLWFPRPSTLAVERQCQHIASLQKKLSVRLTVTNLAQRHQKVELRDDVPQDAMGGYGEYCERPEEIGPALERAFASGKPALVNVVIRQDVAGGMKGSTYT